MTIDLKCSGCGKLIIKEKREYNRRIRLGSKDFYCNYKCAGKHLRRPNKKEDVPISEICIWCKTSFITTTHPKKKRRCCSILCARRYSGSKSVDSHRSEQFKKKMSEITKAAWLRGDYELLNSGKRGFNSKGEIELREYLKLELPEYGFTCGMLANTNGLAPDIWSNKEKVLVEYDGVWHFEDIMGQLKEKQEKDGRLEEWCLLNNWRCIRIKEDLYNKRKEFWRQKIKDEIVNGKDLLVKYY